MEVTSSQLHAKDTCTLFKTDTKIMSGDQIMKNLGMSHSKTFF